MKTAVRVQRAGTAVREQRKTAAMSSLFAPTRPTTGTSSVAPVQLSALARFGPQFGKTAPHEAYADVAEASKGSGKALPPPIQAQAAETFGQDFSSVRVHEGPEAHQVGAVAYTRGENIHFQPGKYDAGSTLGQRLLGHEIAHVVQQRAGRVPVPARSSNETAPINADASLESEADRMSERMTQTPDMGSSPAFSSPSTGPSSTMGIQRKSEAPIQREDGDEDKEGEGGGGGGGNEIIKTPIRSGGQRGLEPGRRGLAPIKVLPDLPVPQVPVQPDVPQLPVLPRIPIRPQPHRVPIRPQPSIGDEEKNQGPNSTMKDIKSALEVPKAITQVGKGVTKGASLLGGNKEAEGITANAFGLGGGVLGLAGNALSAANDYQLYTKGDEAQKQMAVENVANIVTSAGKQVISLANQSVKIAENTGAYIPDAVVPALNIATGTIGAVKSGYDTGKHAVRAYEQYGLKDEAKEKGNDVLADSLSLTAGRDVHQTARAGTETVTNAMKVAGGIVTLAGGPVAPVGTALSATGAGVQGIANVAEKVVDSHQAGKQQASQFGINAGDREAEERAFKDNPSYAARAQIKLAREGDPTAIAALKARGIKKKTLEKSSTENLVKLMLGQLDLDADPDNLTQKVVGGVGKAFDKVKSWTGKDVKDDVKSAEKERAYDEKMAKANTTVSDEDVKKYKLLNNTNISLGDKSGLTHKRAEEVRNQSNGPRGLSNVGVGKATFGMDMSYTAKKQEAMTSSQIADLYTQTTSAIEQKDAAVEQIDANLGATEKRQAEQQAYQEAFQDVDEKYRPLPTTQKGIMLRDIKQDEAKERLEKNSEKRAKAEKNIAKYKEEKKDKK